MPGQEPHLTNGPDPATFDFFERHASKPGAECTRYLADGSRSLVLLDSWAGSGRHGLAVLIRLMAWSTSRHVSMLRLVYQVPKRR